MAKSISSRAAWRLLLCSACLGLIWLLAVTMHQGSTSYLPLQPQIASKPVHTRTRKQTLDQILSLQQPAVRRATDKPICYAVTMSADGSTTYLDGAAVLAHAILMAHSHSQYKYRLVAFVHPEVVVARPFLSFLGWEVLERPVPVEISQIQGQYLREHIHKNGCCGERELIKLWAYTLTDCHRVVHLDMDSIVLQPMDELFDDHGIYGEADALYTDDWGLVGRGRQPPVQGGFFVVKPKQQTFEDLVGIVTKGDFEAHKGWGGSGAGTYYGGQTIQGLLAYYYRILHPQRSKALDRCVYNNMADNPRDQKGFGKGRCKDGGDDCTDCRLSNVSSIKNAHFTICQKPWTCFGGFTAPYGKLCAKLHAQWFQIRQAMETSWGSQQESKHDGLFNRENYLGYCTKRGAKGYVPLPLNAVVGDSLHVS